MITGEDNPELISYASHGNRKAMDSVRIQGVLLNIDGVGVLIRGPAGSGKSSAALRLMDRGHRLVSDDLVETVPAPDGSLIGRAVEETVRIEIRGLGLFTADSLFREGTMRTSPIAFVIDLDRYNPTEDAGRISPEVRTTRILGCELQAVRVPLPQGVDLALVVETLVRRFRTTGSLGG